MGRGQECCWAHFKRQDGRRNKGTPAPSVHGARARHASAPWLSNLTPRCAHPREIMYMSIKDKHKSPGGSCIHKSPKLITVQKSTDRIMDNTLQYLYIGMLHRKIKIDCYIHLRYDDELRAQTKITGKSNWWWQKSEHGYPWGREVLPGKARRDSLHLGPGGLGSCCAWPVHCVHHTSVGFNHRERPLRTTLPAGTTHWLAALEARLSNRLPGTLLTRA